MTSLLDLQLWAQLATALVLGGMVFFAFVFAPLIFMKLPGKTAGGASARSFRSTTSPLPRPP